MKIPKHSHPKDWRWWLRLAGYVIVSVCFLLGPDGVPTPVMWALLGWAGWKFLIWARALFACFHCVIRFVLAGSVVGLLYMQVPYQFYLAAFLVVWLDYYMRFGHAFIREDHYTVQQLISSQRNK